MDPSSLEFAHPAWLYAAAGLCVVAVGLWTWSDRRREADLSRLVHTRFRSRLLPGLSHRLKWLKRSLWLSGALLLMTAAAGPRMGYEWREVHQKGIDMLFAVDTSRSMLAEDLSPNRLERARMGIQDFVERLHGDRVGLIPFAGSAYPLCPLTNDYDAFRQSLRSLNTDIIPRAGTDVASAIREAKRLFDEQKNNHRILVLLTDGEDFQDDVDVAVAQAKKDGMTIYTIGVASAEGGQIPIVSPRGNRDFLRDDSGQVVVTKLDEPTLRKVAETTGGLYAPLGRGAEGLEMIYQEKLRLMPREERGSSMEKVPLEQFVWPLGAGLLLLLVEFLLPDRRRAVKAKALPSAARRHATAVVLVLAMAGLAAQASAEEEPVDPRAVYNAGTTAYEAGDFKAAANQFRGALKTTDLKLQSQAYYNLGNALYRSGQAAMEKDPDKVEEFWKDAVKAYEDALALNPGDEDARHNRDLVQRKLDEMKQKKDQKDQKDQPGDKKDGDKKDGEKKDGEKQDGQKQDGQKQDGQKQDGQKQDGQKQDGQKEDGQKEDGQKEDGQKQDGQKEDGQKQDGQKQDGQKQDGRDGASQDQKGQEGQQQKDGGDEAGEKKEGAEKEGAGKDGEEKDAAGAGEDKKDGDKKEDGATRMDKEGKDGEKKDGEEKKDGQIQSKDGDQKNAQDVQEGSFGERRKPGEMTKEEARQLLKTMRSEEATVLPFEQQTQRQRRYGLPTSNTKGKTW